VFFWSQFSLKIFVFFVNQKPPGACRKKNISAVVALEFPSLAPNANKFSFAGSQENKKQDFSAIIII
jgi:hypothetical protein